MMRRPPESPLFPYATLFRSEGATSGWSRRAQCHPVAVGKHRAARIPAAVSVTDPVAVADVEFGCRAQPPHRKDRKSTRLNSSHANISYAVFCLKKKNDEFAH